MNSVLIECRLFRLWRWQSTSCSWRGTHASHYSYAALASESFVPFPAAPLHSPPSLVSSWHTKRQRAAAATIAAGRRVRWEGVGYSIRFVSFGCDSFGFVSFHFVHCCCCCFVLFIVFRFVFIFICRRWKIVRISCDINRRRVLLPLRRALRFIVFPTMVMHIYGRGNTRGGVESSHPAARVDWSVLISCLFGKPQKYLITCQKVCVCVLASICVRHVNRNQLAVPRVSAPNPTPLLPYSRPCCPTPAPATC